MSMIGTRVNRKEDPAYLTIGGKYVDDLAPADALHAVFVRSTLAHGDLTEVDTADAAAAPGVVGVFTAADLGFEPKPPDMPMLNQQMVRSPLAVDRVRYVGEPIAVVLAETREAAFDAAELVVVDYDGTLSGPQTRETVRDFLEDAILVINTGRSRVFAD